MGHDEITPQYFEVLRTHCEQLAETVAKYGKASEEYRRCQREVYATWRHCMAMLPKHWLEVCGSYSTILHNLLDTYNQLDRSVLPLSARLRLSLIPGFGMQTFAAWLCHAPHRMWELAMIRFMPQDRWLDVWHRRAEKRLQAKVDATYTETATTCKGREVIAIVNEVAHHGGLVDRLRGILSVYVACQEAGRDFRICFTHPFQLSDYLAPVNINWNPPPEINNCKYSAARFVMLGFTGRDSINQRQEREMVKFLRKNSNCQTHVYTNAGFAFRHDFGKLFNRLFRPVPRMERDIESITAGLGADYVSVSARFLNLLGDFNEASYNIPLSPERQRALLDTCLAELEGIHARHPGSRVLICSDSRRFADEAAERDYVAVIPGVITHIDNDGNNTWEYYEKTFLDFFCIARAAKSYLIVGPGMWRSGFPYAASLVGNHELEVIAADSKD